MHTQDATHKSTWENLYKSKQNKRLPFLRDWFSFNVLFWCKTGSWGWDRLGRNSFSQMKILPNALPAFISSASPPPKRCCSFMKGFLGICGAQCPLTVDLLVIGVGATCLFCPTYLCWRFSLLCSCAPASPSALLSGLLMLSMAKPLPRTEGTDKVHGRVSWHCRVAIAFIALDVQVPSTPQGQTKAIVKAQTVWTFEFVFFLPNSKFLKRNATICFMATYIDCI